MRLWPFLIVFAVAAVLGVLLQHDPGYALFAYKNWTAEMPLWVAILLLIAILIMINVIFWIITTFLSPRRVKVWWQRRRQARARKNTQLGLLELAEGHWKKAEKYLSKSAAYSDNPVVNYLSAARAAEETGAIARRDQYLQLAHRYGKHSDAVVKITEAKLQFKHGDIEKSIATLQHLHDEQPKHPEVLKLLAAVYEGKEDWQSLFALLPAIRKAKVFSDDKEMALEQKVYAGLFPIFSDKDKKSLMHFWDAAPRSIKQHAGSVCAYAQSLHKIGADIEAEALIHKFLKKEFDDDLILLYGRIQGSNSKKQLAFAESLIADHKDNANLFLTLGRLSLRNQLWGKARDYLELSIQSKPCAEAYALLGRLMERLGDMKRRDECYKQGLLHVTNEQLEI